MGFGNRSGRGGGYRGSGRGSGRTNGRGGRGNSSTNRSKNNNEQQKDEILFCPFQEGKKQVTYDTVKEKILGIIKKNYKYGNDLVKYINTEDINQVGEKPKRELAELTDEDGNDREAVRDQDRSGRKGHRSMRR